MTVVLNLFVQWTTVCFGAVNIILLMPNVIDYHPRDVLHVRGKRLEALMSQISAAAAVSQIVQAPRGQLQCHLPPVIQPEAAFTSCTTPRGDVRHPFHVLIFASFTPPAHLTACVFVRCAAAPNCM